MPAEDPISEFIRRARAIEPEGENLQSDAAAEDEPAEDEPNVWSSGRRYFPALSLLEYLHASAPRSGWNLTSEIVERGPRESELLNSLKEYFTQRYRRPRSMGTTPGTLSNYDISDILRHVIGKEPGYGGGLTGQDIIDHADQIQEFTDRTYPHWVTDPAEYPEDLNPANPQDAQGRGRGRGRGRGAGTVVKAVKALKPHKRRRLETTSDHRCCICGDPIDYNERLSPAQCMSKHGTKAHLICSKCWFHTFAEEGASHKCPGCKKQVPYTEPPPFKGQVEEIDLSGEGKKRKKSKSKLSFAERVSKEAAKRKTDAGRVRVFLKMLREEEAKKKTR